MCYGVCADEGHGVLAMTCITEMLAEPPEMMSFSDYQLTAGAALRWRVDHKMILGRSDKHQGDSLINWTDRCKI